MTSQRKKLQLYLITAGLSLSAILLSGEILVRLFLPFNNPDTIKRYSMQYLPSMFTRSRLKPMGRMVEYDGEKALGKKPENAAPESQVFINTVGFRGHNFVLRKPQGITRIIITGGSTVFDAYQKDASPDQGGDWPHLVERYLRDRGYNNVEVINAGLPGHASFDALGQLYSQLWIYQPDYVIFYGAWNDIKYFKKLTPETPLISLFIPFYQKSNPFTEYQGLWDRFLSNSQLYVKIRNQYYSWKIPVGEEGAIPEGKYEETYSPYAVRQYQLDVELIVDACRNINANPILLTEATLVSPNNTAEERKLITYPYQQLTHPALVRAFEDIYNVLRVVAKEKAVPILDLAKQLNGNREFFADHVHLSSKGSHEVAKRVSEFLAVYLEHPQKIDRVPSSKSVASHDPGS